MKTVKNHYCFAIWIITAALWHLVECTSFQCQPSSDQSGLVYTPNIPDFYFNHENAANFRNADPGANLTETAHEFTYIFPVPAESHDCSGPVRSIEFCYFVTNTNRNTESTAFNIMFLRKVNELSFRVINIATIQTTPRDGICINQANGGQVCCDNVAPPMNTNIEVLSSDFALGVVVFNQDIRLLLFRTSITEFDIQQHQQKLGNYHPPGNTIMVSQSSVINGESLLLLRMFVEGPTAESVTTTAESTTTAAASTSTTESPDITNPGTTFTESANGTEHNTGIELSTVDFTSQNKTSYTTTEEESGPSTEPTSDDTISVVIIGVIVGGSVAFLVFLVALIFSTVVLVKHRSKSQSMFQGRFNAVTISSTNSMTYNQVYVSKTEKKQPSDSLVYNQVHIDAKTNKDHDSNSQAIPESFKLNDELSNNSFNDYSYAPDIVKSGREKKQFGDSLVYNQVYISAKTEKDHNRNSQELHIFETFKLSNGSLNHDYSYASDNVRLGKENSDSLTLHTDENQAYGICDAIINSNNAGNIYECID